ncbi:MAG: DHH family phosphoesterase [Clostridia bacterium]
MNNDTAIYKQIIDCLSNANSIGIYMHINPDGDSVGSSLSMYSFLLKMGKTVHCFSDDKDSVVPKKLRFMPYTGMYNIDEPLNKYDISLGVDIGDNGRLGDRLFRQFVKCNKSIVIDHHEEHEDFADINLREENSASTTQIIYKLMEMWDKNLIDDNIATLLSVGMITDSGGFSFSSTSSETFLVMSKLMEYDIDLAEITRIVKKDIDSNVYRLKNRVLNETKFYEDDKLGIIIFTQKDFDETGTYDGDTDGIINEILNVTSVELAASIAEVGEKKYKISFRSKHTISAAACAKCFGGGGHFHAAGCRAYGYFEDVYNKVLEVTREMMNYD